MLEAFARVSGNVGAVTRVGEAKCRGSEEVVALGPHEALQDVGRCVPSLDAFFEVAEGGKGADVGGVVREQLLELPTRVVVASELAEELRQAHA